jgi:hypothetical protein
MADRADSIGRGKQNSAARHNVGAIFRRRVAEVKAVYFQSAALAAKQQPLAVEPLGGLSHVFDFDKRHHAFGSRSQGMANRGRRPQ